MLHQVSAETKNSADLDPTAVVKPNTDQAATVMGTFDFKVVVLVYCCMSGRRATCWLGMSSATIIEPL